MIYLNKKPLLEDSFNSFVRSIDIAYALTESYAYSDEEKTRTDRNKTERDPWISKMLDSHYNDIKDLRKTTQDLKQTLSNAKSQNQYERELDNKKFEDLRNVSYEPMTVTKQK